MKVMQLFWILCCGVSLNVPTWAQPQQGAACPHEHGWKPSSEELQQILYDHRAWADTIRTEPSAADAAAQSPKSKANLCNADLSGANLYRADLNYANLSDANLSGANLMEASLVGADLRSTNLRRSRLTRARVAEANLNHASLARADLTEVNLMGSNLDGAYLAGATLENAYLFLARMNNVDLSEAILRKANLTSARLANADLWQANLEDAKLVNSTLSGANLILAQLRNADLSNANLSGADLTGSNVTGTTFAYAVLTNTTYAPHSAPPNGVLTGIVGLETVRFGQGEEDGLIQLRDLLQKNGLRDLERAATFAIEKGRTGHALAHWHSHPVSAIEGVFRLIAFDWTTAYGFKPGRALLILMTLWAILVPVYAWVIWRGAGRSLGRAGIYRVSPKERIEVRKGAPALDTALRIERLNGSGLAALGWSAYFSLLSSFHIGFREFSIGTWLSRIQPRPFVLEPTGWPRTLSGAQSLLSVYLLAFWLLTYFGRPFQ